MSLLSEVGVTLENEDQRSPGHEIDVKFHGELTTIQQRAADHLLRDDLGVFVAPPGVGKTVVGTYLVSARRRSTLILVHRSPLMDQWRAQLAIFLGVDAKDIGQIGGGKRKITGTIDVAMIQSLVRKGSVDDIVERYGHVIIDECHHIPAVSFERILAEAKARYVTGLTATPKRRDGHHPIIQMQVGPVRFSVDPKSQAAKRPFEHTLIVRETSFRLPAATANPTVQELYQAIANNRCRNELILNDVIACLEAGRSPILLTERKDHLDYFARKLERVAKHLVVLKGGMTAKKRREIAEQLADIPNGEERILLATGRYIGEGFDDARLDTLF